VLCEGKNREIRRMLAKLDHKVLKLRRVAIGPVELDKLPKGKSRRLTRLEVEELREMVKRSGARLAKLREKLRRD
jgi:23S rRNA pseudouridine2605 synthase